MMRIRKYKCVKINKWNDVDMCKRNDVYVSEDMGPYKPLDMLPLSKKNNQVAMRFSARDLVWVTGANNT